MYVRPLTSTLAACLLLVSCTEPMGPTLDADPSLRRVTGAGSQGRGAGTSQTGGYPDPSLSNEPRFLRHQPAAPPLETYALSFTARRGETKVVWVDYLANASGVKHHFLRLEIPSDAMLYHPDGTEVVYGESVTIRLTLDRELIRVNFAPHGMVFADAKPVKLRVYYQLADADFDGDGRVTRDDFEIERKLLGMSYQPSDGAPWEVLEDAEQSIKNKYFQATLRHFSGYAISW